MGEIAKLVEGGKLGYLEPKARTSARSTTLMTGKSRPGDHQEAARRVDPRDLGHGAEVRS